MIPEPKSKPTTVKGGQVGKGCQGAFRASSTAVALPPSMRRRGQVRRLTMGILHLTVTHLPHLLTGTRPHPNRQTHGGRSHLHHPTRLALVLEWTNHPPPQPTPPNPPHPTAPCPAQARTLTQRLGIQSSVHAVHDLLAPRAQHRPPRSLQPLHLGCGCGGCVGGRMCGCAAPPPPLPPTHASLATNPAQANPSPNVPTAHAQ